jgi:hypothetical protein
MENLIKNIVKKLNQKNLVNLMSSPNQFIQNGESLVKLNMVTNWGMFWSISLVEKVSFFGIGGAKVFLKRHCDIIQMVMIHKTI